MRHYGSHNLTQPPSSSGRVLRIEIPKPRNYSELHDMAYTYLGGYWAQRTLDEPLNKVYPAILVAVHRHLLERIESDRQYPARMKAEQERRRLIARVLELLAAEAERERQAERERAERERAEQRQRDLEWIEREAERLRRERIQKEHDAEAERKRIQAEAEAKREAEREAERQRQWDKLFFHFDWGVDQSRHYRTLGIVEGASVDEIKRAYRKLAMLTHPDQCAFTGLDVQTANERFRAVDEAYRALTA